ncbi:MAG: hypothetical protein DSZ28_05920 [Thiothrix sp.]|nr:MAG: hypothetical protein DSZ28_05920 [Thiothrix sp.]
MAGARINGNVYYDLLEMSVGSEINGSLVHRKEEAGQVKYLDQLHLYLFMDWHLEPRIPNSCVTKHLQ